MLSKVPIFLTLLNIVLSLSCKSSTNNEIDIHLSPNEKSVIISGLSQETIKRLNADSLTLGEWQHLFNLTLESANPNNTTEQKPLSGKYFIESDQLIFQPDQTLQRGKYYVCRFYGSDKAMSIFKILYSNRAPHMDPSTEVRLYIK